MKKNKKWLKEQLSKQINILHTTISSGNYVSSVKRAEIMNLIDQLEEPEQEKVVIPQFVANEIERYDNMLDMLSGEYFNSSFEEIDNDGLLIWIDENQETFARAWIDGYSVEKEKFYRVKVDQGTNYLYVKSLHLYSDVIEPLDFNYKFSTKEHALKFANRNQAKGVAELVDGEVEEITK